jgi:hypothetical protein
VPASIRLTKKSTSLFALLSRLGYRVAKQMTTNSHPDPGQLLTLARGGSASALGQLLESYRSYLTLLARLHLSRRLQARLIRPTWYRSPS